MPLFCREIWAAHSYQGPEKEEDEAVASSSHCFRSTDLSVDEARGGVKESFQAALPVPLAGKRPPSSKAGMKEGRH